jgi:hypothetical protein
MNLESGNWNSLSGLRGICAGIPQAVLAGLGGRNSSLPVIENALGE